VPRVRLIDEKGEQLGIKQTDEVGSTLTARGSTSSKSPRRRIRRSRG